MRKALFWALTLFLAILAFYPNSMGAAAQSKKRITVPAGTRILIRTVDAIGTCENNIDKTLSVVTRQCAGLP